jgi:hypothetical protein
VSRTALGNLARTIDKNALLRLDDVANYALASTHAPQFNDIDILYPRLLNDSVADRDLGPLVTGSYSLYKFYGSLSGGQRDTLMAGKQMSFTSLSPMQTNLLADLLYNSSQGPNVQLDEPLDKQERNITSTFIASGAGGRGLPFAFGGPISAKSERTVVVPNGITNDGYILSAYKVQSIAQGINSQTGATAMLDAASIAFAQHLKTQPELIGFQGAQYDKYRMAHQSTLSLRFVINPRVMVARNLNDNSPDPDAATVNYDGLPTDFKQKVDDVAKKLGNEMKLPGRNQNPPPPNS